MRRDRETEQVREHEDSRVDVTNSVREMHWCPSIQDKHRMGPCVGSDNESTLSISWTRVRYVSSGRWRSCWFEMDESVRESVLSARLRWILILEYRCDGAALGKYILPCHFSAVSVHAKEERQCNDLLSHLHAMHHYSARINDFDHAGCLHLARASWRRHLHY